MPSRWTACEVFVVDQEIMNSQTFGMNIILSEWLQACSMRTCMRTSLHACAQDKFLDLYINDEGEILDNVRYRKKDSGGA